MIIQCDQCKTKFRLDDSRVTDAGVKVRCSRCKHTFVVKKEASEVFVGTPESLKGPESAALEAEKQGNVSSFQSDRNIVLPGEKGGAKPEGVYPASSEVPKEGNAYDATANDDEEAGFGDFGFVAGPFAGTGKADEDVPFDSSIAPENKEAEFTGVGAEDSGTKGYGYGESNAGSFRLGEEDSSGESGKDFFDDAFSESPDISVAPEDDFTPSAGTDPELNQSWDIFPTEADIGSETPDMTGKDFILDGQPDNSGHDEIINWEKEDNQVLSQEAVPAETGEFLYHMVQPGEPEAEKKDYLMGIMSTASDIKEQSSVQVENDTEVKGEDLPPLAISSRKKKSLFLPVAVAMLLLAVIAAGGAAYYFSWIDFSSLNIPALSAITGQTKSSPAAEVEIRNLDGFYLRNAHGGDIFVVKGEAFNRSDKTLSSVRVRGYIYGSNGQILLNNPADFLNILSRDQLETLPVNEIEAALKKSAGKTADDTSVQPGTAATFQIVFTHVPEGAGEYGAAVAGPNASAR